LPLGDESLIESLTSEEFATQQENGTVSTDTTKKAAHLTFAATLSSKASRKRVGEDLKHAEPPHKIRKKRTCQKCGEEDCPGKKLVAYCRRPCQDCGKVACRGRNSKKPSVPCSRAWD